MEKDINGKSECHFKSLSDIRAYKDDLHRQITSDEDAIAEKWKHLFHSEEEEPKNNAQKFARMLSLGTGVLDGAMLGWKLYRKYKQGAFFFKRNKRK